MRMRGEKDGGRTRRGHDGAKNGKSKTQLREVAREEAETGGPGDGEASGGWG